MRDSFSQLNLNFKKLYIQENKGWMTCPKSYTHEVAVICILYAKHQVCGGRIYPKTLQAPTVITMGS